MAQLNPRQIADIFSERVADDDPQRVKRVVWMASEYGRYGCRRITALLRAEGFGLEMCRPSEVRNPAKPTNGEGGIRISRKTSGKHGSHGRVARNPAQFPPKSLPRVSFRYQWRGTNCRRVCGGAWLRSLPKCSLPYTPCLTVRLGSPEAGAGHQKATPGREGAGGGEAVSEEFSRLNAK